MTTLSSVTWEESGKADSKPGLLAFPNVDTGAGFPGKMLRQSRFIQRMCCTVLFFFFLIITFYFQLTFNWNLNEQVHFNQSLLI